MLNVTGGLKVFLAVEPADMRKGFGGLYALASEKMREDPRQGALFVFTNRGRNRVKLLHFDGTGLWVCVKRLEKGTLAWPAGVEVADGKLRLEVLEAKYLQVDETPIGYLCPGHGKTKKGYLWVYLAPGRGVYFEWHAGRGANCLEDTLGGFGGTVQTDGHIAYESHNKARPDGAKLKLGHCWAHARRGFHRAQDESALAKAVLKDIQDLYRVEAELREGGAGAQQREARRGAESAPMLAALKAKLEAQRPHHLPQSLTGKAVSYALDRWDGLTMYVGNGEMEIDNNLVENAIRPSAIGKKNWLLFGSESGGWQNAVMYTVVQNCKMHGINPEEYLKDVLGRLPHIKADEARELTPAKWLAARTPASRIA